MSSSEVVRETLVDCISSVEIHGDAARAAADYILSDASGLRVTLDDERGSAMTGSTGGAA